MKLFQNPHPLFLCLTAVILLGSLPGFAQNAPYVGSYEVDNFFSTITSNEMDYLRTKKVLFLSRSFGMNMMNGLARLEAQNPMYDYNSSYILYDIANNGLSSVDTNAFSNYNFVHGACTYWPHTQRMEELDTLMRDPPHEFYKQVDVVIVYFHTATPALFSTYTNVMDRLRADYPDIKFIYVTSGLSGPQYATDNTNSAAFGALVRAAYKNKVPLYDLGYILSHDGDCGDVCCPEYMSDPTGLHPNTAGEEQMGKAFLLLMRDVFLGSACTSSVPPTVPGNLSGSALSDTAIKLTWKASTHAECDVSHYEITRNGFSIGTTRATNYTDRSLSEKTAYNYSIRASSMAGIFSAWAPTSTVTTLTDSFAPTLVSAKAPSATQVEAVFSETLDTASAETAANYTLNNSATVLSAALAGQTVTLTTSELADGTNYTLTVRNVADASSAANPIVTGSQASFLFKVFSYPEDPSVWWTWDGNLIDSVNSLTGTWKAGAGAYSNALIGKGLSLSGVSTGSYVQVAHNSLLDGMLNGMAFSIWAKKQTADTGGELFKKHIVYTLQLDKDQLSGYIFAGGGSKIFTTASVPDINNTNWHHYCLVYNGSNVTVHVDGTQRGSWPITGAVANVTTQPLYIGYEPFAAGGSQVFNGQLDEMKVFRRALSTKEVYSLFAAGVGGAADRQAVRNILDTNGLTNKQVDAISVYKNDRITKLYLQEAGVSNLTADIGQLSELTLLHLYGDRKLGYPLLTTVAPEIGNCTQLTELLLAQNELTILPAAITNLTKLTVCSIDDNYLCEAVPAWENWADTVDPSWWSTQDCGTSHPPAASFTAVPVTGFVPLTVTFTDTSTGTSTNKYWTFGDGATTNTTATTISHTYISTGTYSVAMIASGSLGSSTNTKAGLIAVTLPAAPVAGFSASPLSGTAPLAVTFTDSSTGSITNRFWTFGDGATTNTMATTISHTYISTGTYSVAMIASGSLGSSTNTKAGLIAVTLPAAPVAGFSASPLSGSVPLAVTFTDSSSGSITNRFWTFGDGATTNTPATSLGHTYSSTGTYTVALIVRGPGGSATNTQSNVITVTTTPPSTNLNVTASANDREWYGSNSVTAIGNGLNSATARTGSQTLPVLAKYVIPFQLPALPVGQSITNVSLSVFMTASYPFGGASNYYVDVYAGRMATNSVTVAGDWDYGTMVGDNLARINPSPLQTNILKTVTLTASYFQNIYNTDPAAAGKYIFLTLGPDRLITVNSIYVTWTTADNATLAKPTLTITTAPVGGPVVPPPPPTTSLGGSGSFGRGQDVLSWTTVQGSGYVYGVWYSTNLLNGFQPLATNLADTVKSLTNIINAPSGFYQIRAR